MKIAALFFFLQALAPLQAHAVSPDDPAWRALLHFSGDRSSVDVPTPFFLSPEGHKDPAAELRATLEFFEKEPANASCRFPARAILLGKVQEGEGELCDRLRRWRAALRAEGAELVFAAAFLSSPSSMYGHTLLKFVRSGTRDDLLDYTLNYGANTGSVVGMPYVWLGLTGGFSGSYATAPFYLKVKEYNYVENRDFWIYPLKLTPAQVQLLAAHAWELREVSFPYYFLHKNCSYYLLELLEVMWPGSRFTSSFPFWAVPVDTIRRLQRDDHLGPARYRASRYRRLKEFRSKLGKGEAKLVDQLATTGTTSLATTGTASLSPGRETLLLDSAYELWRYRTEGKRDPGKDVETKLLAARAPLGDSSFQPDFSSERPPEEGHSTARAGLAYGRNRSHTLLDLSFRGTLHDLLADPHGYEDFSELSVGDIRLRTEAGSVFLERADVLRLRTIAPRERWIPRNAWNFRTGLARAKEFSCSSWRCLRGGIEGGVGMAAALGPLVPFAFLDGDFEAGGVFDRNYRFGIGPSGGLFTPLWSGARLLFEAEWRFRILGSQVPKRAARLGLSQTIAREWEARVQTEVVRGYREGLVQLFFYF